MTKFKQKTVVSEHISGTVNKSKRGPGQPPRTWLRKFRRSKIKLAKLKEISRNKNKKSRIRRRLLMA